MRQEGENHVKSLCPLWTGLHTCYNGSDNGKQWREPEQILKNYLSSDSSLQLEKMKEESLVIAEHNVAVNTLTSSVHTARHARRVDQI